VRRGSRGRARLRNCAVWVAAAVGVAGCAERTPLAPDAVPETITPPRISIGGSAPGRDRPAASYVPRQIVVKTSPGIDAPALNDRWGTSTILELEDGEHVLLAVPDWTTVRDLADDLLEHQECEVAEPNWRADSPESVQGVLPFYEGNATPQDVVDQEAIARIRAIEAHAIADGSGITVAIVDTGIDASHPDLAASISPIGWDFLDDDADPADEADGIDQDEDGIVDEAAGHGTHVAGLVHTVAPEATLMAVRVLDSEGTGTAVSVARGIRFAAEQGADVINLSLGMYVDADVIKEAIKRAEDLGAVVVSAAGNLGIDDRDHFPSRISETLAVAATDAVDLKAPFSNYAPYVNLSAPGVGLLSTFLDHGYAVWSGTSMSVPLVSGAAALRLQIETGDQRDAIDAVTKSAFPFDHEGLPYEGKMGEGRLDVLAAVTYTN